MTLTESIVEKLTKRIDSGVLAPGSRLPSIRRAAEEFEVSKNTIVEAYDRMVAAGLISSRRGYGFTVADRYTQLASERSQHVAEAVDIASLLSAQLEQNFSIRVGDGRPPASWTEESELQRHLGRFKPPASSREDGYGSAMGYLGLRDRLAMNYMDRGVEVGADGILLTFGANHALDLVIRRLLLPGDTVLVDDPGYYPLFAKLKLSQIRMVGVNRLSTGPDIDDLREKAERERPKIFFTQSLAHNPTGGSMTLPTAHAVLTLAEQHGFTVVEDEPFLDLPTVDGPFLAQLDQLQNVIHIGTFSKTLSASLRCGYVAARPDIIASLAELKMLTSVNSSSYVERLVHGLLTDGHYHRHLKRLSQRIRRATDVVTQNLERIGLSTLSPPSGGYYVYLRFPPGVDDMQLARQAIGEGIFTAPGSLFCVDRKPNRSGMRVNVAWAESPRFYDFLNHEIQNVLSR
ncbi:PLP-dependent aminotransferase family protein [Pacificispira sp.]|uniref:aminotransferase-like domain-containing protein n=1 Tax=Pacificispira sp. TaxID=2888761 RepID=UPI003B51DD4F